MTNEEYIIQAYMDVHASTEDVAYDWYNNNTTPAFGGVSPREMVEMDGFQEVLEYLNKERDLK